MAEAEPLFNLPCRESEAWEFQDHHSAFELVVLEAIQILDISEVPKIIPNALTNGKLPNLCGDLDLFLLSDGGEQR